MKLTLPHTTLSAITTKDHEATLLAMKHCASLMHFANIVYFSDIAPPTAVTSHFENFTYIRCPKFARRQDLCIWFMTCIFKYQHIFADHIIGVQHDGYIVKPFAWLSEFLEYDYIGAPFPDKVVGNGGFCLYSKRLLNAIEALNLPAREHPCHPADTRMSYDYRQRLTEFGVRFAPYELAIKFATDTTPYTNSFGFHGRWNLPYMKGLPWVFVPEHHQCLMLSAVQSR